MLFTSHIRRSVFRILLFGGIAALVVALGGWILERARLGATDAEAFARLERQIHGQFDRISQSLERMATAIARRPDRLVAAANDQGAARALFDEVDAAWQQAGGGTDLAITVYGPGAQPLAWSGRPSEIVPDRIVADTAALFPAPGPLGLRLVDVRPILDRKGRRVGTVASEQLLSTRRGIASVTGEDYTLQTRVAPVSLRTRSEGAGERTLPYSFLIRSARGDVMLEASVKPADLQQARRGWTNVIVSLVLAIAALTVLLLIGPLLDLRVASPHTGAYMGTTAAILASLVGAWALFTLAGRAAGGVSQAFAPSVWGQPLAGSLLRSPFDFLLSSLVFLSVVAVAFDIGERWRLLARRARRSVGPSFGALLRYLGVQLAVGAVFAALLSGYQLFLRGAFIQTRIDMLRFSVHPWDASHLSLAVILLLFHAGVLWSGVLVFRLALAPWRRAPGVRSSLAPLAAWIAAFAIVAVLGTSLDWRVPWVQTTLAYLAVVAAAIFSRRVVPRFRHASQALRLILAFLALLLPAVVMYPTLMHFAERANRREIERTFEPEVMNQREAIKTHLASAMDQIDAIPELPGLVESAAAAQGGAPTESAFWIWSRTDLATHRIASAIELYSADGKLVSRFALYLPEYRLSAQPSIEQSCSWDVYEYVSRFGSEERKLLHAGRAICVPRGSGSVVVGSIVIHAILDYSALPFLSSQNPYYELLRPAEQRRRENVPGGDVDLTVYGWSRTPIYSSAAVSWPLDERIFSRAYTSRQAFWTTIENRGAAYDAYFMNDRGGIYSLAYPTVPLVGHFVNLAEMTTLVGLAYLVMLGGAMLFTLVSGHRADSGRALLREIRASYSRKVFLAFVAVSVIPVITLAFVAQAYIGGRLRADTEAAAVRTAAVAQRVIKDVNTLMPEVQTDRLPDSNLQRQATMFGDDVMVWLSRVIDQDVNIFVGPQLIATSERDLFESQLLPVRTPADVYRAIALDRQSSFVGQERSGQFPYMLAAAPVRMDDRDAIVTVPLMLRQQEIEREIDDMNRRIVLATLLFILIGAGIGYPMAERIADPVNRLMRATRRIARGDLNARIAATSSDELRRLVEAFNSMAADLQRQREQLERTNRLEAWHEMARQVAHEIKNPLTPIQLSAEHLQRVHADRGRPLSPVLDDCIGSILSQVRLLRQISAEFSSFASSPTANPAPTSLPNLIEEVIGPYRSGLAGRISVSEEVPASLPPVFIDRALVGRALANIVENALHAMSGTGTLSVRARPLSEHGKAFVRVAVTDTGIGMDPEALGRLFEPYFSTKAIGTGLGLAIAKRNIALNGGTITVESQKGKGTTVYLQLPVAEISEEREQET